MPDSHHDFRFHSSLDPAVSISGANAEPAKIIGKGNKTVALQDNQRIDSKKSFRLTKPSIGMNHFASPVRKEITQGIANLRESPSRWNELFSPPCSTRSKRVRLSKSTHKENTQTKKKLTSVQEKESQSGAACLVKRYFYLVRSKASPVVCSSSEESYDAEIQNNCFQKNIIERRYSS